MKMNVKKFVYLVNDVTNILLKKERVQMQETAKNLRFALIVVSIILLISVIINVYLLWMK
jgi:fumarate reductase subunit C